MLVHLISTGIMVKGGRHPCLELQESVEFIPNDYVLTRGSSFLPSFPTVFLVPFSSPFPKSACTRTPTFLINFHPPTLAKGRVISPS